MDKELLRSLYNFFKAQQAVSKSIDEVLSNLSKFEPYSGFLDISSEPLWPSWRHEYTDEEIERLNRNYENHCASGL